MLAAILARARAGYALTYAATREDARGLLRRAERAYGGWRAALDAARAAYPDDPALAAALEALRPAPAPPAPGSEGEALFAARVALGWTQREAARRLGVAVTTWCLYERGRRRVPPDAWRALEV